MSCYLTNSTSALDPELVGEVLQTMKKSRKRRHDAWSSVTHEMGFAKEVADRVVYMHEGRIVEEVSPSKLFDSPQRGTNQAVSQLHFIGQNALYFSCSMHVFSHISRTFHPFILNINQKPCKITLHEYVIYDFSLYNEELKKSINF